MKKLLTGLDILAMIKEKKLSAQEGAEMLIKYRKGEKVFFDDVPAKESIGVRLLYTDYTYESNADVLDDQELANKNLIIIQLKDDKGKLAEVVSRSGVYKDIITVVNGNNINRSGNQFKVDFHAEEEIERLFDKISEENIIPDEVVFLLGQTEELSREKLNVFFEDVYGSAVRFIKAIFLKKWNKKVRVVFAYKNNLSIAPELAAFNGVARTVMQENSKFVCITVGYENTDQLVKELACKNEKENDVVYENGRRIVKSIKECTDFFEDKSKIFKKGGVYVITGGIGGVARKITKALASKYNPKIVLSGRRAVDETIRNFISELTKLGAEAVYVSADCSTVDGAKEILTSANSNFGKVDGILHCAGVKSDSYIYNKNINEYKNVFTPKVFGCMEMDEVFKDEPLSFFVVFSSTAGAFGNAGQVDYSYANNFMDNWVKLRNEKVKKQLRRGRTVSINWPLWKDAGMNVDDETLRNMVKRSGIAPIDTEDAMFVLENCLNTNSNQVIVLVGDTDRIRKELEKVFKKQTADNTAIKKRVKPVFDINEKVIEKLREIVSHILSVTIDYVDASDDMGEMGFDSISQTAMVNELNDVFKLDLLPTVFFELTEPTIIGLSSYLIENYNDIISQAFMNDVTNEDIIPSEKAKSKNESNAPSPDDENVYIEDASSRLIKRIKELVSKILDIDYSEVDEADDMGDLGFDSITQTKLINMINDEFSFNYLPTVFFELREPTILGLSEYFIKNDPETINEFFADKKVKEVKIEEKPAVTPTVKNGINSDIQIMHELKKLVSEVIEIPVDEIDENDDLKELGFDSITQTSLVNKINDKFNTHYLPTIFFELKESSLVGLNEYLIKDNVVLTDYHGDSHVVINPEAKTEHNEVVEPFDDDSYAIIGMDCKMPGSKNIHEFWDNIRNNRSLITKVPKSRVKLGAFTENESEEYFGAFVDDVEKFDAAFYGISPHEAEYMDPQQRFILNCSRNAIEDAGYTPLELSRNKTGVFIGSDSLNYFEILQKMEGSKEGIDPYVVTGMDASLIPGRISYEFNLTGPCENINTACSSSLSAVVSAIDSLKLGRCYTAIAGGVNLILSPSAYKSLGSAGMLSPTGKCSTFDEKADGYVRGEGCGVIVLKKLKDAVKDNDHIYAVLCGAELNHGGHANSLTAPNMLQQAELISSALRNSKVNPKHISYVEAHGTGTRLGDPVELNGLKKAFADVTDNKTFEESCAVGSIKTNIGHLEAAAGIAGLIKTILAIYNKEIPGLHAFEKINSNITLENSPFYINASTKSWETKVVNGVEQPRYACISSFGFNGSNAHVILREFKQDNSVSSGKINLIPVSAKSENSLRNFIRTFREFVSRNRDINMDSLAYTMQCGREQMNCRVLMAARSADELIGQLELLENKVDYSLEKFVLNKINDDNIICIANDFMNSKKIDWSLLWKNKKPLKVSLPKYCFDEKTYWISSYKANDNNTEEMNVNSNSNKIQLKIKKDVILDKKVENSINKKLTLCKTVKSADKPVEKPVTNLAVKKEVKKGTPLNVVLQVEDLVCEVLHMPKDEIDNDLPLEELGLDSIGSAELAKSMNSFFNCNIKAFMIYDLNTVNKLAEYIKENVEISDFVSDATEETYNEAIENETEEHTNVIKNTDIAIIGMSIKAPGANNLKEYWNVISEGLDCVTEIPEDRWPLEGFYDERDGIPNRSYCKFGGFLTDIDKFDAPFFRMTPAEAAVIEPQQRLFLEESYKAIEMAGYSLERISGKRCGVYVGVGAMNDYDCFKDGNIDDDAAAHAMLGSANCVLASRISYFLNLKGPAMAIDTACSSSHVAIHTASEALRNNEIEMAIAGGVTLQITSKRHIYTSKSGALSHKGCCSTFDESADGYVPSEGIGAVVLKRLDDAVRDGDPIFGVIKASYCNQDGTTNGITAPSLNSQYELERTAYEKFNIDPRDISYVEAHGTGTKLGDPIEVGALTKAFGEFTSDTNFCAIGSVKANIGHNSAASGVSSLIKLLLAMHYKKIPRLIHYNKCNSQIDFENSPFRVPVRQEDWNVGHGKKRIAAMSGFGLSGTNCHIVVEEWDADKNEKITFDDEQKRLIVVSAKSTSSLRKQMQDLRDAINNNSISDLKNLSYTLTVGRSFYPYRFVCVVGSLKELADKLFENTDLKHERKYIAHPDKAVLDELEQMVEKFSTSSVSEKNSILEKISDRLKQGYKTNLKKLFDKNVRIIVLPSYPFDNIRCWYDNKNEIEKTIDESTSKSSSTDSIEAKVIEVSKNDSDGKYFYELNVNGSEFYLTDHVINKNKVFPAVAYLELVRSVVKKAFDIDTVLISNVVFAQPIIVGENGKKIQVILTKKNTKFEYIINTFVDNTTVCHSQGNVELNVAEEKAAKIDIAKVKSEAEEIIDKEITYNYFESVNVDYGECFRTIECIYRNAKEALSYVQLKEKSKKDLSNYLFHPALMDAMLQSATGVLTKAEMIQSDHRTFLPFVLNKVRVYGDPRKTVYGYIVNKCSDNNKSDVCKLDIHMLDENGNILLKISDFYAREIINKKKVQYYSLDKVPKELALIEIHDSLTLIERYDELYNKISCGKGYIERINRVLPENINNSDLRNIIAYYIDASEISDMYEVIYNMYELVKKLIRTKEKHEVLFVYNTSSDIFNNAYCDAMRAFAKSINQECSKIFIKCISIDDINRYSDIARILISEAYSLEAEQVYYIDGKRYENILKRIDSENIVHDRKCLVKDGVYLLTGGAGRVGLMFAEYLCKEFKCNVVLTGRNELSGFKKEKIDYMQSKGYSVRYLTSDVAVSDECNKLYEIIKREYGHIDGIIHCAGIINDATIFNKTKEDLKRIIDVKIKGINNLYKYFKDENLSLFSAFSAIAAVFGNYGQSDYAYANAYMDSFIQSLKKENKIKHLLSIQWPLWKNGGMTLDDGMKEILEKSEMIPLENEDGVNAYFTALKMNQNCILPIMLKNDNFDLALSMKKTALRSGEKKKVEVKKENKAKSSIALIEKINNIVARKLGFGKEKIDVDLDLNDYGVDSITITALTHTLNDELNIDMVPTVFFELDTMSIACLTDFIIRNYPSCSNNLSVGDETLHIDGNNDEKSFSAESVIEKVKNIVERKLGFDIGEIDINTDLNDYGVDSITITALTHTLNDELGIDMVPTVFFELDTMSISCLTDYIIHEFNLVSVMKAAPEVNDKKENNSKNSAYNADDIAIVGVAAKMPGCDSLDEFWEKLKNAESLIKEIPDKRFSCVECGLENNNGIRHAALMKDVDKFAAEFFNISRREAELMDPQQRIILELVWNLFENAGYSVASQNNSNTGVFLGISNSDYYDLIRNEGLDRDKMCTIGLSHAITANRVSYYYNFNGPSEVLNSACSSSLLAVHRAIKAILSGECSQAVAGGISTILSPVTQEMYGKMGVLSQRGIVSPFDAEADGIIRGEGAGLVLLKKLSDAERDKDYIHGVIKGSFVNHGGRTSSLTVPSVKGQTDLIYNAVRASGVDPRSISYIECHGTGTKLGDPIEVDAIRNAYLKLLGELDGSRKKCALGSVKSNVGHLEAASGIAGIFKILLSFKNNMIPATINFKKLNPYIKIDNTPFYISSRTEEWKNDPDLYPRRAGISSFGLGGANVHMILEEYHMPQKNNELKDNHLIALSSDSSNGLKLYAEKLLNDVCSVETVDEQLWLNRVEWTLQYGRNEFNERLAIVCHNLSDLRSKLVNFINNDAAEDVFYGSNNLTTDERIRGSVYRSIALDWVNGKKAEWEKLWNTKPFKQAVAGYEFTRQRYWVSSNEGRAEQVKSISAITNSDEKQLFDVEEKCQYMVPEWKDVTDELKKENIDGKNTFIIYVPSSKYIANQVFDMQYYNDSMMICLGKIDKSFPDGSIEINASNETLISQLMDSNTPDIIEFVFSIDENENIEGRYSVAKRYLAVLKKIITEVNSFLVKHSDKKIEIRVITDKAFSIGDARSKDPELSALYGLIKCAAYEYKRILFRYIDIDTNDIEDLKFDFESNAIKESLIALRNGRAYVRELKSVKLRNNVSSFRTKGVYIVLGGGKGIGYEVCKYIVKKYNAIVIITGRSVRDAALDEKINSLNGNVSYYSVDISDYSQMSKLMTEMTDKYGKVNGILNSTGVVCDKMIERISDSDIDSVLLSKIKGNDVLMKVTENMDLDFIVAFSSIASFSGKEGRGLYTSGANTEDQICISAGFDNNTKMVVINWSYWDNIGMQVSEKYKESLIKSGIDGINVEDGMEALERIISSDEGQVAVIKKAAINEKTIDVPYEEKNLRITKDIDKDSVRNCVIKCLIESLKLDPSEIDEMHAFNEYGVDSLLGIEIIEKINSNLNIDLRPTDLINYPNLKTITEYIIEKFEGNIQHNVKTASKKTDDKELIEALYRLSKGQEEIKNIENLF